MNKIKRIISFVLAFTLSIIMFSFQICADTPVTYRAQFEHEAVDSFEYMTWDSHPRRNWLMFGIDLTCYECDSVDSVKVSVGLMVAYLSSSTDSAFSDSELVTTSETFTYLNTDDSDELLITIQNFDRGYDITLIYATVIYELYDGDSVVAEYSYSYEAYVINEIFGCTRE